MPGAHPPAAFNQEVKLRNTSKRSLGNRNESHPQSLPRDGLRAAERVVYYFQCPAQLAFAPRRELHLNHAT
jgi:hypothetical protein